MNEHVDIELSSALVMAAAFSIFGRKRRMEDPEYAAAEEELLRVKAEAKYVAEYNQALVDNAEHDRNPRAFLRRLSKTIKHTHKQAI